MGPKNNQRKNKRSAGLADFLFIYFTDFITIVMYNLENYMEITKTKKINSLYRWFKYKMYLSIIKDILTVAVLLILFGILVRLILSNKLGHLCHL